MAEIKGIEFEVKGSADKAVTALENLANTLRIIKESTSSGGLGLGQIAKELRSLNKAISETDPAQVLAFATSAKALGRLRISGRFARSLSALGEAAKGIKTANLSKFVDVMTSIANVSGNTPDSSGLSSIRSELETISQISFSNLDGLAEKLFAINSAWRSDGGNTLGEQTHKWAQEMANQVESTDKGFIGSLREVTDTSDIEAASRAFRGLGAVVSNVFSHFSSARASANGAVNAIKGAAQASQSVGGDSVPVSSPKEEHIGLWQRLRDAIGDTSASLKKFPGTLLTAPFSGAIKSVKEYASKLGKVSSSFKRIIGYRLVRTAIKEVGQAFREGIQNVYQWSVAFGGPVNQDMLTFAQTMDDMATSLLYFKNSVGAAFAPLVNILRPALEAVTNSAVALLNVVNQLIARLTGQGSWTKAIRNATEYGEAVGGAGSAAREALRYLAPFDELNVLPDDSNRGRGGGSALDDYGGMFEEVTEFEQGISDFADRVRELIENGEWTELGTLLGEKINSLVEKIDFAGIGTKIGENVNAWFTTKYWTLKETNFENIGKKIAEFFTGDGGDKKGILGSIDFETIGRGLVQQFTNLGDLILGGIENINWETIGDSLGDYVRGVINEAAEWISDKDWGQVIRDVFDGIVAFVKGLDIGSLLESIASILGSVSGAILDIAGTIVTDVIDFATSADTWQLFGAWLKDIPTKIKNAAVNFVNAFVPTITAGLNNLIEKFNESDFAKYFDLHIDPIEFSLLPTIPQEELTKNYDEAKATLEARSKKNPTSIASSAIIKGATQAIPRADKIIEATAKYTSSANGLSKEERTVSTWARYDSSTNNLTKAKRTVSTWAQYNSSINALSKGERTVSTWARYDSSTNNLTKAKRTVSTWAQYNSSIDNLTKADKTFDSTAKWSKQEIGESWAGTTWASTAKWAKQEIGDSWGGTTWDSTARFTDKYVDSELSDPYGRMKVDTVANITDVTQTAGAAAAIAGILTLNVPTRDALGGAFYGGKWHDIPQYAGGGRTHGSLFLAGEAGPEIVGHVGGRTEVLNQSQLAATMYSAVRNAMAGIRFQFSGVPAADFSDEDSGMDEEALYRAMMRALNDSDYGDVNVNAYLDGEVVYRDVARRNRQNTRMTGVNAFA